MMILRSLRRCLVAATALAAMGLGFSSGAEAGRIRIGMTTWVGYGPMFLARDLGYFKDAGVDVDLKIIEESSMTMAAIAGGDLDGAASTVDEMMKYRSDDLCFKYVLGLDESHGGDGLLTQTDVSSVQDLKGKQVALNEGSVSEFWFDVYLQKSGLSPSDVQVTNMTADDAAAAFIAGRVPAAVTWEPHLTEVRNQGKGKVFVDSSTLPGLIVDTLALKCNVIKDQASDVKAFVKAYYRAIDYMKANPEKAAEIMAKGVGGYLEKPSDFMDAEKGVNFFDRDRNVAFFGTPQKSDMGDLIAYASGVWGKAGKIKMKVDAGNLADASFVAGE